jgi:pullulanase/glycogen debranching enzyme
VRFVRRVFAFRRTHAVLRREAFYTDPDIQWFNPRGHSPDWLDSSQKCLACLVRGQEGPDLYLMFNAGTDPTSFVLPELASSGRWQLAIDTAQPSLGNSDIAERDASVVKGTVYVVGSRSSVILVASFPEPSTMSEGD